MGVELIALSLLFNDKNLTFLLDYIPPNINISYYAVHNFFDNIKALPCVLLSGDLNAQHSEWGSFNDNTLGTLSELLIFFVWQRFWMMVDLPESYREAAQI